MNVECVSVTFFSPFLRALQKKARYMTISCNMVLQHKANYKINVLNEVSEDRLISCRLWPAGYPGLNPRDLYLWGNLGKKYLNNPHTLDEFKHNNCEALTTNDISELKLASNNLFKEI
jgi:hypothetical protein